MNRFAAFFLRDLRIAATYPFSLVVPFISIAVTVAGFAFLSRIVDRHITLERGSTLDYFGYVVVNLAFMLLLNQALQSVAQAIRRDQLAGTMESILATTAPLPSVLVGSSLWPFAFALVQVAAYFGIAHAMGMRLPAANVPGVVGIVALSATVMAAFGIIVAAIVLQFKQAPPSSFLTGGAAALLTGVLFPISLLPKPLQAVSWLLPLTHALHGIRLALSGESLAALRGDLEWLGVAAVLLIPAGLIVFSYALRRARIDGNLSTY